ncbi:MAG: agmatinase [Candidatus Aminicenantes bacterium]|nr:agmatinase [Candidatus Aminicenantes bacterium]
MNKQYGGLNKKEFSSYADSQILILPVPYDGTSSWVKGSSKGPSAIIEASEYLELYDIETDSCIYTKGIHTLPHLNVKNSDKPEFVIQKIKAEAEKHLDKFIVMLGGEHSITTGLVQAFNKTYDEFSVLQLDAHTDSRERYKGSAYNHASVMARVRKMHSVVQVGIRSMAEEEKDFLDWDRIFLAKDIYENDEWMPRAVAQLGDQVYVTIDVDVFETSIMPSTGTPEPGGLGWYQVLKFLKAVAEIKTVIAFDVVELCPNPQNKSPDFLAAKLVYKLLSYIF